MKTVEQLEQELDYAKAYIKGHGMSSSTLLEIATADILLELEEAADKSAS